ncbi:uncharacterized protein LOC110715993 [Chenopodium quinoa]|uniref:uncharacterized protein LOC110715993 n=1 Tax=Chenopodium quinoa TaxID=63459 RepID=UPI000B778C92|nr:uncharacterized protein LOC110715993 [Chenopodium quinoa]
MMFSDVSKLVSKFTPNFSCGVDSVGTKGGLALFSWYLGDVFCVASSPNFIFCNVGDISGSSRHILFLYGASKVEDRASVWEEISTLIATIPNVLVMGDINQLEYYSDKLGGASLIKGLDVFLDWRFQTNLLEVPFSGPRYTWSNKRLGVDLIMERLDRAYSSSQWFNDFPDGRVVHEPITVSDHAAIIYDTNNQVTKSNRPYQIETWCLVFPEIKGFIDEVWSTHCTGSVMYKFLQRSKWLRNKIKRWCLDNKKVWGINWRKFSADLSVQGEKVTTLDQGSRYVEAINDTIIHSSLEFRYWQQRMKDKWIKEGDISSKMMYGRVKHRQKRREIITLRTNEDEWIQGQNNLEALIINSLKEVYNPPMVVEEIMNDNIGLVLRELELPPIDSTDAASLVKPFSHQEIRKAMFSIHNLKAPGYLLKELNASILVMIPKVEYPELPTQFRPIILCNTIYKCIAKCLVNRMKHLLPNLISEFQHAFVPRRYIEDNVMLSHELLHLVNTSDGESTKMVIKLDMSKAYDRVNLTFLLRILKAYGFPEKWIQWISQCISTVSYKTLINGQISEMFKPDCGLRQGDPLSPYLFLFCMDILSRMLTMAEHIKKIKGLRVTRRSPSITHLFFADDAMLFLHATPTSCHHVIDILSKFGEISGQQLNLNKSFVKFSKHAQLEEVDVLKGILKVGQVSVMEKHLGAPIDFTARKLDAFKYLIDKVATRTLSWAALNLSQSVKLILINTVLISISAHVMKCFKLPVAVTNRIDSLITRFWWGNKGEKGMYWVKKRIIQRPKGMGGLGIRSMSYLNDALLFKQVARMHCNPQLLVARSMEPTHSCSLCTGESRMDLKGGASWGRCGLFNVANKVVKGYNWKIGNGDRVKVANMRWVQGSVPVFNSDQPLRGVGLERVKDLISRDTKSWNVALIRQKFEWSTAQKILEMELPSTEETDRLYWGSHASGVYTVKTGYAFLMNELSGQQDASLEHSFYRLIWKLNIPPKWSLFLWKLVMNGLAVKGNLARRGIDIADHCDSCEIDESTPLRHWIQHYILLFHSEDGKKSDHVPTFIGVLWSLWLTRNGRIFRNEGGYLVDLFRNYNLAMKELSVWRKLEGGDVIRGKETLAHNFPPGFERVNIGCATDDISTPTDSRIEMVIKVDGSWSKRDGNAGAGWAYSVNNQAFSTGGGDYGRALSPLHAELLACVAALRWTRMKGKRRIVLFTDSLATVQLIKHPRRRELRLLWTIQDLLQEGQLFQTCLIWKVSRDQVAEAHDIATRCRVDLLSFSI